MHEVISRRGRKLLSEQGGPFPDLLVIDGVCGCSSPQSTQRSKSGLANLVAVGIAKKEELPFTRATGPSRLRACS